jgi:hypothetical protein
VSEIIAATFMWAVVVSSGFGQTKSGDRSILISSTSIAVALTLNIDDIYTFGDAQLGGRNLLELFSDLALMVGISFLLRAILRATRVETDPKAERWAAIALLVVCTATTALFSQISAVPTSTTFMMSFGNQVAAASYSMVQFIYVGAAMAVMGRIALRHSDEMTNLLSRISLRLVSLGCACAIALSATIIAMDLAHLAAAHSTLNTLSLFYGPLYNCAIALLCVGFALLPVVRKLEGLRYARRTKSHFKQMSCVWNSTVDTEAAISASLYAEGASLGRSDLELRLHRMIMEVRDATIERSQALSPELERKVQMAEAHLFEAQLGKRVRSGSR